MDNSNNSVYNKKNLIYDVSMAILSLIAIIVLLLEFSLKFNNTVQRMLTLIDNTIWLIFFSDYFIRLFKSKNKFNFIKNNKADLISIIPFYSLFKTLRIFKLFRVIKLAEISKLTKLIKFTAFFSRFNNKFSIFLRTNNFDKVLYTTISIILLGTISISLAENMPLADSLWWSFVTTTTVGYGDISPTTAIGRIIAGILMLVGIGFIGMLTGTIATYFLNLSNNTKEVSYKESIINDAMEKLKQFDSLSKEELSDIFTVLNSLKK